MIGRLLLGLVSCLVLNACQSNLDESHSVPRAIELERDKRPNILLIVADDLAVGDLSFAGSEIPTPTIDSLANEGSYFRNFYTAPSCAPTRAMLLTGVDANIAGLGIQGGLPLDMPDEFHDDPIYSGYLSDRVVTVATHLGEHGYRTFMAGKWHLGHDPGMLPHERGFQESAILPHGGASHFDTRGYADFQPDGPILENGEEITLPEGYYSTDYYTERLIEYIRGASKGDAPFFGYAAYTAPHWPLQAPAELIERHVDTYRAGWDEIRQRRFKRQVELGYIPEDMELPARWRGVRPWVELSPDEQAIQARTMATYAAMLSRLDQSIARLLGVLEETGEISNTIVLFMSDNGADQKDIRSLMPQGTKWRAWLDRNYPATDLQSIGGPDNFASLGKGWAQASTVQFRLHKSTHFEGGVRSPLIIRDFRLANSSARIVKTPWFVTGITPTILDWAGIKPVDDTDPFIIPGGVPMNKILDGESVPITFASLQWGMAMKGRWKLVKVPVPGGGNTWMLFDLEQDPAEQNNLVAEQPQIVQALKHQYDVYASNTGIRTLPKGWNIMAGILDITNKQIPVSAPKSSEDD